MAKRIRILATSDTHGYIFPYRYTDGASVNYGMARMNTLIKALRDENTIVIENGDVLEGSPLNYYHFHYHKDEISPVTKVIDAMGYDYINLGNHDFNYGKEVLYRHLDNIQAPCITSNMTDGGEHIGPTYVIRKIAGKKVAVFGLLIQYIPHWEPEEHIRDMKFLSAVETAQKTVDLLKHLEKPDYIICVYHGGFERDLVTNAPTENLTGENEGSAILNSVPGIDVLISGHQHVAYAGTRNGIVYTQTHDKAAQLACVDIYTDTGIIEPRLLEADTEPDPEIMAIAQEEEEACQKWLDEPLGVSKVDLTVTNEDDARLHKHQIITFLNKAAMEASGADLAANSLFVGATGFKPQITMRDIVCTYVYPNTMVVKKITGKILREYLEYDMQFWSVRNDAIVPAREYVEPKPQQYNYDMIDGVEYTVKVSNSIGQRVISLTRNGVPVKDDDVFTLCISDYRASGGGDFNMLRDAPTVKEISQSFVEILADWVTEHKVIDFEPVNNIQIIK